MGDAETTIRQAGAGLHGWSACATPAPYLSAGTQAATQIGTSAFRLTDRARVPTNLRKSRSGPQPTPDSHTSQFQQTTRRRQPPPPPPLHILFEPPFVPSSQYVGFYCWPDEAVWKGSEDRSGSEGPEVVPRG